MVHRERVSCPFAPEAGLWAYLSENHESRTNELVQRGRMILEVAGVDLQTAQARFGLYHEITWYFRHALAEVEQSWRRLEVELGAKRLAQALEKPACTVLDLNSSSPPTVTIQLILIAGGTYRVESVAGTPLAPKIWRLTRLSSGPVPEPYYVLRRADGTTQCDCAEWIFRIAETNFTGSCKHLSSLQALRWL